MNDVIRTSNERFIYCSQTATCCVGGRCVETGICNFIADGRCTSSAEILARAREMNTALRVAVETSATPDAWLVLSADGWRYLSGGEGDARQRMHNPTDELYPLYRGELKANSATEVKP
jgi:hypothetical protein